MLTSFVLCSPVKRVFGPRSRSDRRRCTWAVCCEKPRGNLISVPSGRRSWGASYETLKNFQEQHGHLNIPSKDRKLYEWCVRQRTLWARGELPLEHYRLLSTLGFSWDKKQAMWTAKFYQLVDWRNAHGHCNVPWNAEHIALARWVTQQRHLHKTGRLSDERRRRLIGLGLEFDPAAITFTSNLKLLRRYVEANGHAVVPREQKLGRWLDRQRIAWRNGRLDVDAYRELRKLGFCFQPHEESWEGNMKRLADFRQQHGHVMPTFLNDRVLYLWINLQRQRLKCGTLSIEHRVQLQAIGVDFRPRRIVLEEKVCELEQLYATTGELKPEKHTRQLTMWCNYMRQVGAKGVGKRRAARLQRIGFFAEADAKNDAID